MQPFLTGLLKLVHAEAELSDFFRLPGQAQYEFRVRLPGVVPKCIVVPESMVRRAALEPTAVRALRNLLATIIRMQHAQESLDRSREVLRVSE